MRRRGTALLLLLLSSAAAFAREMPDRALIVETRDEVFARPEFRPPPEVGESAVVAIAKTVGSYVLEFAEQHPTAFAAIVVVLVATLIVLVAHIVWTVVIARRQRYAEDAELPALDLRRSAPDQFRDRALQLAKEGRYDAAVRELYAALLLTLDARGDVRYARHKALLDYRHEARADDARGALDAMAGGYLPSSFGRRPLPEERFRDLLARLDAVRA